MGRGQRSGYSEWLRAGRSGHRISVGARFYAPFQKRPGAQPASYTMGNGSFRGANRQGRYVDHKPTQRRGFRKRRAIPLPLPPWAFVVSYRVNCTLTLALHLKQVRDQSGAAEPLTQAVKTVNSKTQLFIRRDSSVIIVTKLRVERGSFRGRSTRFCVRPDRP